MTNDGGGADRPVGSARADHIGEPVEHALRAFDGTRLEHRDILDRAIGAQFEHQREERPVLFDPGDRGFERGGEERIEPCLVDARSQAQISSLIRP